MESRSEFSKLDLLFHRLAVVNARVHEVRDPKSELLQERREIMELITRERLGQVRELVWRPGETFTA